MSELILPFAIMALTVFVLVGLLLCFRKWLALRDQLDREAAATTAASSGTAPPRHAPAARRPAQVARAA
jgi:hypothetical protein